MSIDSATVQVPAIHAGGPTAEILAQAHAHARRFAQTGDTALPTCAAGFTVTNFAITYPNDELVVIATVTGIPDGAVLQGVTIVGAPSATSATTYAMATAANSAGLPVPLSLMGASTAPSFSTATAVTGLVIITYTQAGEQQTCGMTQAFTVGG